MAGHGRVGELFWKQPLRKGRAKFSSGKPRTAASPLTPDAGPKPPLLVGLTGGLPSARRFLLHPFLQEVFASLGGAPNLARTDISATVNMLRKKSKTQSAFDLCSEDERNSLAELIVKAAKSVRANEFLIDSLQAHSALSLTWVISALQSRARHSFIYIGPTCLGYSADHDAPDAEVDLLAIVDGEAIMCEVKSSWRSLWTRHI